MSEMKLGWGWECKTETNTKTPGAIESRGHVGWIEQEREGVRKHDSKFWNLGDWEKQKVAFWLLPLPNLAFPLPTSPAMSLHCLLTSWTSCFFWLFKLEKENVLSKFWFFRGPVWQTQWIFSWPLELMIKLGSPCLTHFHRVQSASTGCQLPFRSDLSWQL